MGLRLIKQHFTFSCTRFLFIKEIHSISKGVFFSFIDNSPNVLKVVYLSGGQAAAVPLLPAWVHFYLHKWLLSLWKHNLTNFVYSGFILFWKTNCVFKRLYFETSEQSCHCNQQPQKGMEFAFEMNQLKIQTAKSLQNLWVLFQFSPNTDHFSSLASKICAWACFFRIGRCGTGAVSGTSSRNYLGKKEPWNKETIKHWRRQ